MQLEVGDMILWVTDADGDTIAHPPDTGWVVHLEQRLRNGHDLREYVVVHWLSNNSTEEYWTEWLLNENCKIIKGG